MITSKKVSSEAAFLRLKKASPRWQALEFKDGKFACADDSNRILMIAVDRIISSRYQPRQSFDDASIVRLADSIRNHDLIQPITVRRTTQSRADDDFFEIVAGERRFRAAKVLGMNEIPCIITEADELQSAEISIIENTQREDLNFFDEAAAIASLIKLHNLTQEEAAERLSVSQPYIANKLRILRLTTDEREKILEYGLSERHARALLRLSSQSERLRIIEHVHAHNLTAASTEAYIERCVSEKNSKPRESFSNRAVLKDIRVFYNSVDRAISSIKQAGISVESERTEENGVTVLTIRISDNVSRETL